MECPHCYKQVKAQSKSCPACGGFIPPGQHLLQEVGLDQSEPAIAATPTLAARSTCYSPRLASLGDRFNAFLLDTIVLFGVFAMADAWILMRWGSFDKLELSLTTASLLLVLTVNAIVLFAYGWVLEGSCGATLGKVMVGIRVARTGRRSALEASAIRNLLRLVDGLGFYLVGATVAGCSPWRQRLGDLSAGTTVVEQQFGTVSKIAALVAAIAVLGGSAWAVPRICAQQNAAQPTRYLNQVIVRVGRTDHTAYFRVARVQIDIQVDPNTTSLASR